MTVLRSLLIALSEAKGPRKFAETNGIAKRLSKRFVAGTTLPEVLSVVTELNALGISVTLDALGENVDTEAEAQRAAQLYYTMIDEIATRKLDANVSLKLTQMGMDLGNGIAESIVAELTRRASKNDTFVRVDMEGSKYTQATIDMVRRLFAQPELHGYVGIVVQAYLFRTEADVAQLISDGIRMRLCKGAYLESSEIAFPSKEDTDKNYIKLSKTMLKSGIFHGLATHDEAIISEMKRFAKAENIDLKSFEFQMLYGIRRDLQESLVKEGYRVRVYIPFGGEWYPYFMRRLAERPANVLFILKNMLK